LRALVIQQQERFERKLAASSSFESVVVDDAHRAKTVKSVDVCFVFDCTGSMTNLLEGAAAKMCQVKAFISAYLGCNSTVRFAVVAYRDYGYKEPVTVQDFTENGDLVSETLKNLRAHDDLLPGAMCDSCEDVISGIQTAVDLDWSASARVLYLACDFPHHGRRFHDYVAGFTRQGQSYDDYLEDPRQWNDTDEVFVKLADLCINLVCLKLYSHCDKMYRVFEDLNQKYGAAEDMMVLSMTDTPSDFASCVMKSAMQSISQSFVKLGLIKTAPCPSTSSLNLEIEPVDWDMYKSWPEHRVEVMSNILDGVDKPMRWSTYNRRVHLRPQPFAQGAMRYAFPAVDQASLAKIVVKVYKFEGEWWRAVVALQKDACAQAYAHFFAGEFSKRVPDHAVEFVRALRMKIVDGTATCEHLKCSMSEPFIPGKYEKYTNNGSYIAADTEWAQAFSHFTWHFTEGQLMVVDIQGSGSTILTDPQIHSRNPDDDRFGYGNLGTQGMDAFFLQHVCNDICASLQLQPSPMQRPRSDGDVAVDLGYQADGNSIVSADSAKSAVSTKSPHSIFCKVPRNYLCAGPCGTFVRMTGRDFVRAKAEYGGVFCAGCLHEVRDTTCIKKCPMPGCQGEVRHVPLVDLRLELLINFFAILESSRRHGVDGDE